MEQQRRHFAIILRAAMTFPSHHYVIPTAVWDLYHSKHVDCILNVKIVQIGRVKTSLIDTCVLPSSRGCKDL